MIDAVCEEELPDGALATRYRFAHGFCQEVVYEDLGSKRRTTLHQRAGQALKRHHGADSIRRMRLILASASPRRAELLTAAGIDFDVVPAAIDETPRLFRGPRRQSLAYRAPLVLTTIRKSLPRGSPESQLAVCTIE